MPNRTIYLISFRSSAGQRAHFGVFVPSPANVQVGTLIHVAGSPMAGYRLEFKRNYSLTATNTPKTMFPIGEIAEQHILHSTNSARSSDNTPRGDLERAASQIPPPGISQNPMVPVNNVSKGHFRFMN